MATVTALLTVLALGVAAIYFTIAALVVPKIGLSSNDRRFTWTVRIGATLFFVGCGLTHIHIALHTIEDGGDGLHEIFFHVLQLAGGIAFVVAALRYLEISIEPRERERQRLRLAELEKLATRDALTGIYNRRQHDDVLGAEIARHDREGVPVSVIRIDIDDMKGINDLHGHQAGDAVLRALAGTAASVIRPSDSVARIGGDEFAVVLPATPAGEAMTVAARLTDLLAGTEVADVGRTTVSAGVAGCPEHALDALSLDAAADAAVYESKRRGGGCSTLAEPVSEVAAEHD